MKVNYLDLQEWYNLQNKIAPHKHKSSYWYLLEYLVNVILKIHMQKNSWIFQN